MFQERGRACTFAQQTCEGEPVSSEPAHRRVLFKLLMKKNTGQDTEKLHYIPIGDWFASPVTGLSRRSEMKSVVLLSHWRRKRKQHQKQEPTQESKNSKRRTQCETFFIFLNKNPKYTHCVWKQSFFKGMENILILAANYQAWWFIVSFFSESWLLLYTQRRHVFEMCWAFWTFFPLHKSHILHTFFWSSASTFFLQVFIAWTKKSPRL